MSKLEGESERIWYNYNLKKSNRYNFLYNWKKFKKINKWHADWISPQSTWACRDDRSLQDTSLVIYSELKMSKFSPSSHFFVFAERSQLLCHQVNYYLLVKVTFKISNSDTYLHGQKFLVHFGYHKVFPSLIPKLLFVGFFALWCLSCQGTSSS